MNQEREEIAILIRAIFGSNSIRTFVKINSNFNGLIPVCDILKFTCYQDCRFGKVPLDRNCSSARMGGREIRLPEIVAMFSEKIWPWKVHFYTALFRICQNFSRKTPRCSGIFWWGPVQWSTRPLLLQL